MKRFVAMLCLRGHSAGAECLTLHNLDYLLDVEEAVEMLKLGQLGVQLNFRGKESPGGLIQILARDVPGGAEQALLNNGMAFSYTVKAIEMPESREPFTSVSGVLKTKSAMQVACISSAEDSPNPEWFLKTLGRLRPTEAGCETKEN